MLYLLLDTTAALPGRISWRAIISCTPPKRDLQQAAVSGEQAGITRPIEAQIGASGTKEFRVRPGDAWLVPVSGQKGQLHAPFVERNIIAFSVKGEGITCATEATPNLVCNAIFGNEGEDRLYGVDGGGNLFLDPLFCGPLGSGNLTICSDSPCAPENNSCRVLIGARPIACVGGVKVKDATWGWVKSLYGRD